VAHRLYAYAGRNSKKKIDTAGDVGDVGDGSRVEKLRRRSSRWADLLAGFAAIPWSLSRQAAADK
jgi:hypothetical protein